MDQIKIGRFIAERRKKVGLTQAQLAEKMNITDRAVSKWETGKAMPDSSIMLELCDVLEITVNDLLTGEVITMENNSKEMEKNLLELVRQKEEADKRLLEAAGCDVVFMPTVEEVYPEPDNRVFNLGPVAEVMEGAMRPGHFNGVAQIVSKLFMYVEPDRAYFGEKDFQQIAVIREMVRQEGFRLEIVPCPIVREADGLAKSSRNVRLTPENRAKAPAIAKALMESVEFAKTHTVAETHDKVVEQITAAGMEVEYYQIVDSLTMQAVENWDDAPHINGCVTVYCGDVRLIDNIAYK